MIPAILLFAMVHITTCCPRPDIYINNALNPFVDDKIFFSWRFSAPDATNLTQQWFRIQLAGPSGTIIWDSGTISSPVQTNIQYGGPPLTSSTPYSTFVTTSTTSNNSFVCVASNTAGFFTALLNNSTNNNSWGNAVWLQRDHSVPKDECSLYQPHPVPLFRREFTLNQPLSSLTAARIYFAGLGYSSLWVNGNPAQPPLPGTTWTGFHQSVPYTALHLPTNQFYEGTNCIGVMVGNGFWNPLPLRMFGHFNLRDTLAIGQPTFKLRLELIFKEGTTQIIDSSEASNWFVGDGAITKNNLYLGEVFNGTQQDIIEGWSSPGYPNARDWPVAVFSGDQAPKGHMVLDQIAPMRIVEYITPKRSWMQGTKLMVDFGLNFAGFVSMKLLSGVCSPESTILLRYGEILYPNGSLNVMTSTAGQIKSGNGGPCAPAIAFQSDTYTCGKSPNQEYRPTFTWHAFRYMEVSGPVASKLTLQHFQGIRIYNNHTPISDFKTSSPILNRIHEMTLNSFRNNLIGGVQTDCPHRERFGYGGDAHATAEAIILNYDVANFFLKRLHDFETAQRQNGGITETAPFNGMADGGLGGDTGPIEWEVIFTKLQMVLKKYTRGYHMIKEGNLVNTEHSDFYESTYRFVWFLKSIAEKNNFVISAGLGDWSSIAHMDVPFTSTVFLYEAFRDFTSLAITRGDTANATEFLKLTEKTKQSIYKNFFNTSTKCFSACSQADLAFGFVYGLISQAEQPIFIKTLLNRLSLDKNHFSTGIWGTKFLLATLAELGHADLALTLLQHTDYPSFGYMLGLNATTIWEVWDYSDNVYSHNHAMFGGIEEFFWNYIAGIAYNDDVDLNKPQFILKPYLMGDLTFVNATLMTPYGVIRSYWVVDPPSTLRVEFQIPPNTRADIWLPLDTKNSKWMTEKGVGSGVYTKTVKLQ